MTNQGSQQLFVTAILVVTLCGCSDGPKQYKVAGSVSYKGQKVVDGTIIFAPDDGIGPSAVGTIADGRYTVLTTAGKKKIRVTATRETGRMRKGAMGQKYAERVDIVPPKYNSASTLVRTVDPSGDWVINFPLE